MMKKNYTFMRMEYVYRGLKPIALVDIALLSTLSVGAFKAIDGYVRLCIDPSVSKPTICFKDDNVDNYDSVWIEIDLSSLQFKLPTDTEPGEITGDILSASGVDAISDYFAQFSLRTHPVKELHVWLEPVFSGFDLLNTDIN